MSNVSLISYLNTSVLYFTGLPGKPGYNPRKKKKKIHFNECSPLWTARCKVGWNYSRLVTPQSLQLVCRSNLSSDKTTTPRPNRLRGPIKRIRLDFWCRGWQPDATWRCSEFTGNLSPGNSSPVLFCAYKPQLDRNRLVIYCVYLFSLVIVIFVFVWINKLCN